MGCFFYGHVCCGRDLDLILQPPLVWLENGTINFLCDPEVSRYPSCKVTQELSCSRETNSTRRWNFIFQKRTLHLSIFQFRPRSGAPAPAHEFRHRRPVSPYISLSSTKVFICHFYLLNMSWQYKVDRWVKKRSTALVLHCKLWFIGRILRECVDVSCKSGAVCNKGSVYLCSVSASGKTHQTFCFFIDNSSQWLRKKKPKDSVLHKSGQNSKQMGIVWELKAPYSSHFQLFF